MRGVPQPGRRWGLPWAEGEASALSVGVLAHPPVVLAARCSRLELGFTHLSKFPVLQVRLQPSSLYNMVAKSKGRLAILTRQDYQDRASAFEIITQGGWGLAAI